jgi:hypothetical protein
MWDIEQLISGERGRVTDGFRACIHFRGERTLIQEMLVDSGLGHILLRIIFGVELLILCRIFSRQSGEREAQ